MRQTAAIAALLALAPLAPAQDPAPEAAPGTDIVCLLDASRSVGRADPDGRRFVALMTLLAAVTGRGGDRVAVAQWSSDAETRAGAVLLPWTEVPADYQAQGAVLDAVDAALARAAATTGRASDWNAATGVALQALRESRGEATGRPLWVLLVTDGQLDPVRGDDVPPAYYPDPIPENGGLRTAVTDRARALFESGEAGLAQLLAPGVTVSAIRVGDAHPGHDLLALVAERASIPVHELSALGAVGVARAALDAIEPATHPAARLQALVSTDVPLGAGETVSVSVPAPEDSVPAVSLVSAPPGTVTIRPMDADGGPMPLPVRRSADGRVQVVVWHRTIGRPRLAVQCGDDATGLAQVVHLMALDYEAVLGVDGAGPFSPDEVVGIRVSLQQRGHTLSLTAGPPLDDLRATLALYGKDRQGTEILLDQREVALDGEAACTGTTQIRLPEGAAGACRLEAVVQGLRVVADGPPLYQSPPARSTLAVRAPLAVSFGLGKPWVQQAGPVLGQPDGPRPPADLVTVAVSVGAAEPVAVELAWDAERGRYGGTWTPDREGDAEVRPGAAGAALVKAGPDSRCQVQRRSVRLLDPDPSGPAAPLAEVTVAALGGGSVGVRARLEADLGPGEAGRARFLAFDAAGTPVAVALEGPEGLAAADGLALGPGQAAIVLRFPQGVAEGATLRLHADLPGGVVERPIGLVIPPGGALFRLVAVVLAAVLLALAGLLFARQTTPQFEHRHLKLHSPGRNVEHTRYLREFPRQGWGRQALGTPEAPRSVAFKLAGLRGVTAVRCRVIPCKPYIRVNVNGEDVTGGRELANGDQIVLKGATLTLRYTYYETDDEAAAPERPELPLDDAALATRIETLATARVAEPVRLSSNEFILLPARQLEAALASRAAAPGAPVDLFAATIGPDEQPTAVDPADTGDERAMTGEMDPNDTVDEGDSLQEQFPVSPDADPAETLAEDDIAIVEEDGADSGDTAETVLEPAEADSGDTAETVPPDQTIMDLPAAGSDTATREKTTFDEQQLPDFLR